MDSSKFWGYFHNKHFLSEKHLRKKKRWAEIKFRLSTFNLTRSNVKRTHLIESYNQEAQQSKVLQKFKKQNKKKLFKMYV
jgi:hypothetical protein